MTAKRTYYRKRTTKRTCSRCGEPVITERWHEHWYWIRRETCGCSVLTWQGAND